MGRLAAISTERRRGAKMHTYSDFGVYLHQGSPCDRGCNGLVCGRFSPGLRKNLKSRTFRSFCPLFERADCTAVKTAKAKEEDRTKIDPLEKSYVSTETGQVQIAVSNGRRRSFGTRSVTSPALVSSLRS